MHNSCCTIPKIEVSNVIDLTTAELAERLSLTVFIGESIPDIIELIEDYREGVLSGYYNTKNLPILWYDSYYSNFMGEAVTAQGIAGTPSASQLVTLEGYNKNLSEFSSAKLYQQQLALDKIPKEATAEEFNQLFNSIVNQNSVNWTNTESTTIFMNSNSNALWKDIVESRDSLPYLQYITAEDERVRPTHASMNGIIKAVKDPFWATHNPANGYNCRCTVVQLARKDSAIIPEVEYNPEEAYPDKGFGVNWGNVDYVISKDHSYFDVAKGDAKLKANNFNLPPKKLGDE